MDYLPGEVIWTRLLGLGSPRVIATEAVSEETWWGITILMSYMTLT